MNLLAEARTALEANLKYQKTLEGTLSEISATQERIEESLRVLRAPTLITTSFPAVAESFSEDEACYSTVLANPGESYFTDENGKTPPLNAAAKRRKEMFAPFEEAELFKRPHVWIPKEVKMLQAAIDECRNVGKRIKKLKSNAKAAPSSAAKCSAVEDAQEIMSLNWEDISRRFRSKLQAAARGNVGEKFEKALFCSPFGCQQYYMHFLDPRVNRGEWKKDEDQKLYQIAAKHKFHDWETIARDLDTRRTPIACLMRFQQKLNPHLTKSKWTAEEDDALREAVKELGVGNWDLIAAKLGDRNGDQCSNRWNKHLDPNIRSGPWSKEEDRYLTNAVRLFGADGRWSQIGAYIPGRTDAQCRERWTDVLDPEVNHARWTTEEDKKLMNLIKRLGASKWAEIAKLMDHRTDNQCRRRWKTLSNARGRKSKHDASMLSDDEESRHSKKNQENNKRARAPAKRKAAAAAPPKRKQNFEEVGISV